MKLRIALLLSLAFQGISPAVPAWQNAFQLNPPTPESSSIGENSSHSAGEAALSSGSQAGGKKTASTNATAQTTASPSYVGDSYDCDLITPEIQDLADSLGHDPLKLYEYVHNHIEYECYFGSKKGAYTTLMEGGGNDFDQASLLIALLRASGLTANYGYGTCRFSYADMMAWWGLGSSPFMTQYPTDTSFYNAFHPTDISILNNPASIALARRTKAVELSAKAAGYFRDEPVGTTAETVSFRLPLVWVQMNIDGTAVKICPAIKHYTQGVPVNLGTAMGYNRTNLLSAMGVGSTAGSPDSIKMLNEAAMATSLTAYTTTLLQTLGSTYDSLSMDDLLGKRKIDKFSINSVADLPTLGVESSTWLAPTSWLEIPTNYISALTLCPGQNYDETTKIFGTVYFIQKIYMPHLRGRTLSLTFSGTNSMTFKLGDELLATQTGVIVAPLQLEIGAEHDHFWWNDPSFNGHNNSYYETQCDGAASNVYVFAYNTGDPTSELINHQTVASKLADTDPKAKIESLQILGLSYMQQGYMMDDILAAMYPVNVTIHHNVAVFGDATGLTVDHGLMNKNISNPDVNFGLTGDFAGTSALFGSAMEGCVLEQNQGKGEAAVSTTRMIELANSQNIPLYRATASNWTAVKTAITPYYAAALVEKIRKAVVDDGAVVLVPGNGHYGQSPFLGDAYAVEYPGGGTGMMIGKTNGGLGVLVNEDVNVGNVRKGYRSHPATHWRPTKRFKPAHEPSASHKPTSDDPIDLYSGTATLDETDITVGPDVPLGLRFSRHYNSNATDATTGIGAGWTHSGSVVLTERSAADASFGRSNTYQAAPMLVALWVAKDLHYLQNNATLWTSAALTANWGLLQANYNAVSVPVGQSTLQFVKMPDGTYQGPPGTLFTLTKPAAGYRLAERNGNAMQFDSLNRLSTIQNSSGATLTYTYTGVGTAATQITDAYGRYLTLTWVNGLLTKVTDNGGRVVQFAVTSGNLTKVTDTEGKAWTYGYDTSHRMTVEKDPSNRTMIANDYDSAGHVSHQRSKGDTGRQWSYRYTDDFTVETDPSGASITTYFDSRGRSVGTALADGSSFTHVFDGQDRTLSDSTPEGGSTTRTYDSRNDLTSLTDPDGYVTHYEYETGNSPRLINATDARGKITHFTYYATSLVQTVTDPNSNVITYTYDTLGNLKTVKDALLKVTTYDYDKGAVSKKTSPDGKFQTLGHDGMGNVTTVTDQRGQLVLTNTYNRRRQLKTSVLPPVSTDAVPASATTTYEYDDCGNLSTLTDALGNVTSYTYDSRGQNVTTVFPALPAGSDTLTKSYDNRDLLIGATGPISSQTFEYNSNRQLTGGTNSMGYRGLLVLDQGGRPVEAHDPLDRVTKKEWSNAGRLMKDTDAAGNHVDYTYDENGNRTGLKNRRGYSFISAYDDAGRLTSSSTPLGKTTGFQYQANNLVKKITRPSGKITEFTYDDQYRPSTMADADGTITYGYDDAGHLLTVTEGSKVVTRTYNERGQVKSYTDTDGDQFLYSYNAIGKLSKLTYPGNKVVTYAYNSRNLLSSVTDWSSRVTSYDYDQEGRLATITRPNGTRCSLTLDPVGRPIEVKDVKIAGGKLFSYLKMAYDPAGQMVNRFQGPAAPSVWSTPYTPSTYNSDNQIISTHPSEGESALPVSYDADGNATGGPFGRTMNYDSRNRMTSSSGWPWITQVWSMSYTYDPEGARTSMTSSAGTTKYAWSGGNMLMKTSPSGVKTYYIYGQGLLYEVDATTNATKTSHYDCSGNTLVRTNDAGDVIGRAGYHPYGELAGTTGDMDTPFLFCGRLGVITDPNGLCYMRARYYCPEWHTFLTADPAGFEGGTNWYAYANGNPLAYADPFGLTPVKAIQAVSRFFSPIGDWYVRHFGEPPPVVGELKSAYFAFGDGLFGSTAFGRAGMYDINDPDYAISRNIGQGAQMMVVIVGTGGLGEVAEGLEIINTVAEGGDVLAGGGELTVEGEAIATETTEALGNSELSFGKNSATKLRDHWDDIRAIADEQGTPFAEKFKESFANGDVESVLKNMIEKGETRVGPYKPTGGGGMDIQWTRLGSRVMLRRASGEFFTIFKEGSGQALNFPGGW